MSTIFLNHITRRATLVWLLLVSATCITGWLAETERGRRWATISIVLIASVKIWLIMREFMELKSAPIAWRVILIVWLAGVTAIVLSNYWLAV